MEPIDHPPGHEIERLNREIEEQYADAQCTLASVIVEKDLTDEVNDNRLTIHGAVQGMQPDWTILVEVFTDAWYPQEPATVRGGLWRARPRLAGQGTYNNHKIRVTLQDESGAAVATATVNAIVRMNPCEAP